MDAFQGRETLHPDQALNIQHSEAECNHHRHQEFMEGLDAGYPNPFLVCFQVFLQHGGRELMFRNSF